MLQVTSYRLQICRLSIVCWLSFIVCYSCSDSRFPGYSKTENGLFYKIVDIGDGENKAKPGDYVTARIIIKTGADSVLFDTRKMGTEGSVTLLLSQPEYPKDYREGFQLLAEGDSAVFVTDAYTLFMKKYRTMVPKGMNLESVVYVEAKILNIRTPEQHEQDMLAEKKKLEEGEFEEKKILEKYLVDSNITVPPIANGMYYIKETEGRGITPDSARTVLLNFKGCFLNGRCFDVSFETQPFDYRIDAEEQLIRGLEIGVRKMHEGEKAKFIIPSHLAFGSSGSSTGMVPPYTTVVYEVELLKVQ